MRDENLNNQTSMGRRTLLLGSSAAAIASATHLPVARAAKAQQLTTPREHARAYAKLVASLADTTTYLQYVGEIFAVVPGQIQQRLFRLKGLVKIRSTPQGEDAYRIVNFDHGLFCDADSGAALETWANPYTGAVNRPLHYRSGPFENLISTRRKDGSPFTLPWDVSGDDVRLTESSWGERDNWLQPKDWPRASTGAKSQMSSSSTYVARLSELVDPARDTVTATHFWTFLAPWPAWMLMGPERPGVVLWRWVARKLSDPREIDPVIIAQIERRTPGFMSRERPWPEYSNGWIQYTRERGDER